MLKRIYILVTLIFITSSYAQNTSLQKLKERADYYVRRHSPEEGIFYITKKLNETDDLKEKQVLIAIKLFPLSQLEMFDSMVVDGKKLLEDTTLNNDLKVIVYLRLALVYEILEDFKLSKNYLDLANSLVTQYPELITQNYGELLYRYASLYRVQNKKELALNYVEKSISFADKNNYYDVLAVAYMVKGFLITDKNIDINNRYFKLSLDNFKAYNDSVGAAAMYQNIGKNYFKNKNYKKAHIYTDSSILYSKRHTYSSGLLFAYTLKSNIFKATNQLNKALLSLEKYHSLKDSVEDTNQKIKVKTLEYQFLIEKEKINQSQIFKVNQATTEDNKNLLISLGILIVLLTLLVLSVIIMIRKNKIISINKQKISLANMQLEINVQEKEILLKELHHRVKNNLSLVLSLINFQAYDIDNSLYQSKFIDLKQRVEAIAIVHEQMMIKNSDELDDTHDINNYITQLAQSVIDLDTRTIVFKEDIPKIKLALDVAVPLGILINELLSNSLKHAEVEFLEINLKILELKDHLKIIYCDNGAEFNNSTQTKKLGLFIIDSMVTQLKGYYEREGSSYTIKIKKDRNFEG